MSSHAMTAIAPFDIAVIGGGPAGIAAALWAARYRRRVVMIDAGQPRNRWTEASHGYLALDGVGPAELLEAARHDLRHYPEIEIIEGQRVMAAHHYKDGIDLVLDNGQTPRCLRVVLATGVRDVFPDIDRFEEFFGRSIFTCPSCDGYEAQAKAVAVVGDSAEMANFAVGMLDWAGSVVAIRESTFTSSLTAEARGSFPLDEVVGSVIGIEGIGGQVTALRLDTGRSVACEVVFWLMHHDQQSDLAQQLGCKITAEGCVVVDDDYCTTVPNVYAAGDMTPGPHLVQIAAAQGALAGIAAAVSLRGDRGVQLSPRPAPDPEPLVHSV